MTTYIINSDNYSNFNGIFSLEDKKVIYNFTQTINEDAEDNTPYYYQLLDGTFLIKRYDQAYIISKAGNFIKKFPVEAWPSIDIHEPGILYTVGNGYIDFHKDYVYNTSEFYNLANSILNDDTELPQNLTVTTSNLVARWDYGTEAMDPVYTGDYTLDLSELVLYRFNGYLYTSIVTERISATEIRINIPVIYAPDGMGYEIVCKLVLNNTNRTGVVTYLYDTIRSAGGTWKTYGMENDPATYVALHENWEYQTLDNIWNITEYPGYSTQQWKINRYKLLRPSYIQLAAAYPGGGDGGFNYYYEQNGDYMVNERNLTFEYDRTTFTIIIYNMLESKLRPIGTFVIPEEHRVGESNDPPYSYTLRTLFCRTRQRFVVYNNNAYLALIIEKYGNTYNVLGETGRVLLLRFNGSTGLVSIERVFSLSKEFLEDSPNTPTGLEDFPNVRMGIEDSFWSSLSYIGGGKVVNEDATCDRSAGPNYRRFGDSAALVFDLNTYTFTYATTNVTVPEFTLEDRWTVLNIPNTYRITGTVTDGGLPVPNAAVNLINKQGYALSNTTTDQNGVYSITTFDNTPMTVLVSSPNTARKVQTHLVTPVLVGSNSVVNTTMDQFNLNNNLLSGEDPLPGTTTPPPPLTMYLNRSWSSYTESVKSIIHIPHASPITYLLRVNHYVDMGQPSYTFVAKSNNDQFHLFIHDTTTLVMMEKVGGRITGNTVGWLYNVGSWIVHGAFISDDGNRVLIPERSSSGNGPGNSYPHPEMGASFICYYRASGLNYTGPTAFNKLGGPVFPGNTYRSAATFSHNNWNYDRITFVSGYFTTTGWPGGEYPSVKIEYNFNAQQGTWVQDPASFVQLMRTSEDAADRYFSSGSYLYTYTHWVQFIAVEGPEHEGIFLKDVYEDWYHKTTLVQTVYRYRCYSTWDTELTPRIQYLNGDLEWARAAVTPVPADPPYNNDPRYNLGLFIGHWSAYYGGSATNLTKDTIIKHWQDPALLKDYEFMFVSVINNNHGGLFPKKIVHVYRHPNRVNYLYIDMHRITCQYFNVPLNISSADQLPLYARQWYGVPRDVYGNTDMVNGTISSLIPEQVPAGSRLNISPSGNKLFMLGSIGGGRFNWGVLYSGTVIFELTVSGNTFDYAGYIVSDSCATYEEFLAIPEASRTSGNFRPIINIISDTEIEFGESREVYTGGGSIHRTHTIHASKV